MSLVSSVSAAKTSDRLCAATLEHLAVHGWAMQDSFLPSPLIQSLAQECQALSATGALRAAKIGRAHGNTEQPEIRGDRIRWLEQGQSAACDAYLQLMEALKVDLNEAFYLGLHNYESHFAHYAPGRGYAKHVDRFRDDDHRIVSVVLYLNTDWHPDEGGALRIYGDADRVTDVGPQAGRLALFRSADIAHQVMPATRDRLSLAGWFRRRD